MSSQYSLRLSSKWLVLISFALALKGISIASSPAPVNGTDVLQYVIYRSIAGQLSRMGVETNSLPLAGQLEILASPAKDCLNPSVQDLYWDNLRKALYFRMTCGVQKASAPFLVRAHVSAANAAFLRQTFRPDRGIARTSSMARNRCQQSSLLVRAGRPATLLLRRENMKLTTPVVALECGTAGQQVRARARKTNKLFEAEVVGENLLAARF